MTQRQNNIQMKALQAEVKDLRERLDKADRRHEVLLVMLNDFAKGLSKKAFDRQKGNQSAFVKMIGDSIKQMRKGDDDDG